jgi:RNA-directed DNA polymerase
MKVPDGEGVANHTGPESCVYIRKGMGEALTGDVRAGLLSRERYCKLRGADAVHESGRQHWSHRYREMWLGPAWSKTPSTYVSSLHGNREVPRLVLLERSKARAENPKGVRQR